MADETARGRGMYDPRLRALVDDSLAAIEDRRRPPQRKRPPRIAPPIKRRVTAPGCRRCGERGHYAKTCGRPVREAPVQALGDSCPGCAAGTHDRRSCSGRAIRFGRPQKCSHCKEPGHKRRACPRRVAETAASLPVPALVTPPVVIDLPPAPAEEPPAADEEEPEVSLVMARLRSKATVKVNGRVRSRSLAIGVHRTLTRDERRVAIEYPDVERPRTRGDCEGQPRPCPFVSCRHHLYLDVNARTGTIKFNFPHLEVEEMTTSCTLDVADRGGITLDQVGEILNLTRERIRQVETRGLEAIREAAESAHLHTPTERHASPLAGAQTL